MLEHMIQAVPNAGAAVTATNPAGAWTWYGASGYGATWDGTNFWSTDSDGATVRKYAGNIDKQAPASHGYTYWNGTQETTLSPLHTTDIYARHISRYAVPPLPAGVTQVRIYSGRTSPHLKMERQGTFAGTAGAALTVSQAPVLPVTTADATNPPPPTSNFPGGSAYNMHSLTGGLALYGDGTMAAPLKMQSGSAVVATTSAATQSVAVVFLTEFAAAPKVTCNAITTTPDLFRISHSAPTTTGVTIYLHRTSGSGNITVDWQAIAS